ncbi:MAG: flagellar hook-length control protein FliK [Desulfatiglandales bacterium]
MKDVLPLNNPMGSMGGRIVGRGKNPKDVGASLFRDFLVKKGQEVHTPGTGLRAVGKGEDGSGTVSGTDAVRTLEETLAGLGLPLGQLRLPDTALPQLVEVLEKQGIGRDRAEQVILAATEKDGTIHMGRLLAGLQNLQVDENRYVKKTMVESDDVPRVEWILGKMGLEPGEAAETIAHSIDPKGDLDLNKVAEGLKKFIPGGASEEQLSSLWQGLGVKGKPEGIGSRFSDPEVVERLRDFSEAPSQEVRQVVKQDLAGLLVQKGVPPQEVKTFLDGLSVRYSDALLRTVTQSADSANRPASAGETASLLNQVITPPREWKGGGWDERILEILKQGNLLTKSHVGGEPLGRKNSAFAVNSEEWMKSGDQQTKRVHPGGMTDRNGEISPELKMSGDRSSGRGSAQGQAFRAFVETGEFAGSGMHSVRVGKGSLEMGSFEVSKNTDALPHPLPKIAERMIWMIRGGEQKGSLHISPPELGRLDLDLVVKNGHLQANLSAENPAVKEIIESNLNQLKQQLADQGFVVEKFEVMVGHDGRNSRDNTDGTTGGRKREGVKKSGTGVDALSVTTGAAPDSPSNLGLVDMHV